MKTHLPLRPLCLVWAFILTGVAGAADPANPPSKVENPVKEADLPLLKLTEKAAQRLALKTTPVESKSVPQTRPFPGTVLLPLTDAATNASLAPLPLNTPDEFRKVAEQQTMADGAVATARATLNGTELALQRADKLAKEKAGGERFVEEARTRVGIARAALQTAIAQRALLGVDVATALKGPRRWVTVSISAAELPRLDSAAPASLRIIGDAKSPPLTAKPITAPPTAAGAAGTLDFYFEVESAALRPGQRVQMDLSVKGSDAARLIVPWSAVLYDPQGGAWVYEETAPFTYVHRRVSVLRVAGADAILESGPAPGAKIVSTGAAELFGAEFGGFK